MYYMALSNTIYICMIYTHTYIYIDGHMCSDTFVYVIEIYIERERERERETETERDRQMGLGVRVSQHRDILKNPSGSLAVPMVLFAETVNI